MADEARLIFISGGVRSGKSSFAEKLAASFTEQDFHQLHYIAAGQASDCEMVDRVTRHRLDRNKSGLDWRTWEQPMNLWELSSVFTSKDVVLLDCLTTLLSNEFFHCEDLWKQPDFQREVHVKIVCAIEEIARNAHSLIVVSNEVLFEPLADNEMVLVYARLLGEIHQAVVRKAKLAYIIESGIPVLKKGGNQHERNHGAWHGI